MEVKQLQHLDTPYKLPEDETTGNTSPILPFHARDLPCPVKDNGEFLQHSKPGLGLSPVVLDTSPLTPALTLQPQFCNSLLVVSPSDFDLNTRRKSVNYNSVEMPEETCEYSSFSSPEQNVNTSVPGPSLDTPHGSIGSTSGSARSDWFDWSPSYQQLVDLANGESRSSPCDEKRSLDESIPPDSGDLFNLDDQSNVNIPTPPTIQTNPANPIYRSEK